MRVAGHQRRCVLGHGEAARRRLDTSSSVAEGQGPQARQPTCLESAIKHDVSQRPQLSAFSRL